MPAYSKKQPSLFQKILGSRLFQVVLLILIGAMGWQVYDRYVVERSAAERRTQTESEYQQLLEQRTQLAEQVDDLYDEFGIESEIRRNFDVAKEGEQIVVILEDDLLATPERTGPQVPEPATPEPEPKRWYQLWR